MEQKRYEYEYLESADAKGKHIKVVRLISLYYLAKITELVADSILNDKPFSDDLIPLFGEAIESSIDIKDVSMELFLKIIYISIQGIIVKET